MRCLSMLSVIALVAGFPLPARSQPAETPVFKSLHDAKLAAMAGLPACFSAEVQRGDPSQERAIFLIHGAANCFVPWHWHGVTEVVMIVNGTLRLQMKEGQPVLLRSGGYSSLPEKHVHRGGCVTPCTFFAYSDGPFDIHYVDEAGREIPADEALKTSKPTVVKKR
jgi:quercetin dioxygenase-like cupin family protein